MCQMNRCAVGVANGLAVALHCVLFCYSYLALSRRHWTTPHPIDLVDPSAIFVCSVTEDNACQCLEV